MNLGRISVQIFELRGIGSSPSENAFMTTSTVITMVLILGFVWGGFSLALVTAVRKESDKGD